MNLQEIRDKIDKIDAQLLKKINQRTELSLEIGRRKRASGTPVLDAKREEKVLKTLSENNPGPLPQKSVVKIFKAIIAESRNVQEEKTHSGN